jgi:hypothetical protein
MEKAAVPEIKKSPKRRAGDRLHRRKRIERTSATLPEMGTSAIKRFDSGKDAPPPHTHHRILETGGAILMSLYYAELNKLTGG